jgi:hypothetical protein
MRINEINDSIVDVLDKVNQFRGGRERAIIITESKNGIIFLRTEIRGFRTKTTDRKCLEICSEFSGVGSKVGKA